MTVRKLRDDLDFWIFIGIGDDIVKCPSERPEYQHLVSYLRSREVSEHRIPKIALFMLKKECERSVLCGRSYWVLKRISMKRGFDCVLKKVTNVRRMLGGKKEA